MRTILTIAMSISALTLGATFAAEANAQTCRRSCDTAYNTCQRNPAQQTACLERWRQCKLRCNGGAAQPAMSQRPAAQPVAQPVRTAQR